MSLRAAQKQLPAHFELCYKNQSLVNIIPVVAGRNLPALGVEQLIFMILTRAEAPDRCPP